jgi:GNAT superfamily N-acetyltransferase
LEEARKIIRFTALRKVGRKQYPENDNKLNVPSTVIKDIMSVVFNISSRHYLLREEPAQLVTDIDVRICRYDETQDKEIQIGEALAFFVKCDLALEYGSLFQVMSAHSQILSDVYSALFRKGDKSVNRTDQYDFLGTNLLFIDYLCLHPEYRGYGLGRPLLMGIIEEIGCGAEIVIIEPVPVRFEDEDKNATLQLPSLNDEEHERVRRKLCEHWKPLGFTPVEETERFQYLSTSILRLSVKELLNEAFGNR